MCIRDSTTTTTTTTSNCCSSSSTTTTTTTAATTTTTNACSICSCVCLKQHAMSMPDLHDPTHSYTGAKRTGLSGDQQKCTSFDLTYLGHVSELCEQKD